MSNDAKRLAAVCVGLALFSAEARAQVNPYTDYTPVYPSRYWGYAYDAYSGVGNLLTGQARLIRAQGQFAIDQQTAVLKREEIVSARIDNRRKKLEQWLWEREMLPTLQDDRERTQQQELRRSLDPPVTEIWSAKALNDLLGELRKIQSGGVEAGAIPVNPEVLAQINVTSGKSGGNIALLKGGKVSFWPGLLRRPDYAPERERIDQLVGKAAKESENGHPEASTIDELIETSTKLERTLTSTARAKGDKARWTFQQYTDAMRFLHQLDDALRVLQEPDAGQYLAGKYVIKGRTVADVVKFMKEQGVSFAPANPGTYTAYRSLHSAMVDYARAAGIGATTPK